MIKLLKLISEIKMMGRLPDFVNFPDLIPPDENDTLITWMNKNDMKNRFIDKIVDGYSVKPTYQGSFLKRSWGIDIQNLPEKMKVEVMNNNIEKLGNKFQEFFDRYCGKGRIKVKKLKASLHQYGDNNHLSIGNEYVRFHITERPRNFKMIPRND